MLFCYELLNDVLSYFYNKSGYDRPCFVVIIHFFPLIISEGKNGRAKNAGESLLSCRTSRYQSVRLFLGW